MCTPTINSVDVDPAFGCSNRVEVGCVADVSEESPASISSTEKMDITRSFETSETRPSSTLLQRPNIRIAFVTALLI